MHKILIIGPAWVGDMVMAQTLFILLRQQDPNLIIDVLAPPWSAPLLERMPEVRKSIALPIPHGQLQLLTRYRIAKTLRIEKYDMAIVLPNSYKSALIPFFANIPKRTGWLGEWRWGILNDVRYLNKKKHPLMIDRFMALGITKNIALPPEKPQLHLSLSTESIAATRKKFNLEKNNQPILALCAGAEFGPSKRWPSAHYAAVANQMLSEGWQVWLFGSPKDQIVTAEIMEATQRRCVDLAGKTQLSEGIDLLSLANIVVSNDSGLMHIAAALNRPLIVVYGSTSPAFTPPLNKQAKILNLNLVCSPCFKRECPLGHLKCLNDLHPQLVLQAIHSI